MQGRDGAQLCKVEGGGGRAGIFQSHKKFSHDILRLSLKDVRFAHCRLIKLNQNEILYEIFIASYL